jgi:hypothetical protein
MAADAAGARATDRFDFVEFNEAGGDSRLFFFYDGRTMRTLKSAVLNAPIRVIQKSR